MSNNSQPQPQWTANPAEVENLKKILSGATTGNSQIQAQMMNVSATLTLTLTLTLISITLTLTLTLIG